MKKTIKFLPFILGIVLGTYFILSMNLGKQVTLATYQYNPDNEAKHLNPPVPGFGIFNKKDENIEGVVNGSPSKKIGLFDDYKLKVKFVVEDDEGHIDVVDSSEFKLNNNLKVKK